MAKFQNKRGPIPRKVFSDRGLHLEKSSIAQQNSNIHHGEKVLIGQDAQGQPMFVKVGEECPKCRKRVRGLNHVNGDHHRGIVSRRNR